MASTAQQVITSAMELIDQSQIGYTPTADHLNGGLEMLNRLIESWATEGLLVAGLSLDNVSTHTSGTYTWGSGGDITSTQPAKLKPVGQCINAESLPMPFRIVMVEEFYAIADDLTAVGLPDVAWYDYGKPTGKLYLWPAPPSGMQFNIQSWKPITAMVLATSFSTLPTGAEEAVQYNLAVTMASKFRRQIPEAVAANAAASKARLQRIMDSILGQMVQAGSNQ